MLLPDSPVVAGGGRPTLLTRPGTTSSDSSPTAASQSAASTADPIKTLQGPRASASGDADLTWTRLTLWRALLAAALDVDPAYPSASCPPRSSVHATTPRRTSWPRGSRAARRSPSPAKASTRIPHHLGGGARDAGRRHRHRSRGRPGQASYAIPVASARTVAPQAARDIQRATLPRSSGDFDPDDVYAAAALAAAAPARRTVAATSPSPPRKRKDAGARRLRPLGSRRPDRWPAAARRREGARRPCAPGIRRFPRPTHHAHAATRS